MVQLSGLIILGLRCKMYAEEENVPFAAEIQMQSVDSRG